MDATTSSHKPQGSDPALTSGSLTHNQVVAIQGFTALAVIILAVIAMVAVHRHASARKKNAAQHRQLELEEAGLAMISMPAASTTHLPGMPISLLHLQGLDIEEANLLDSGVRRGTPSAGTSLGHRLWQGASLLEAPVVVPDEEELPKRD